MIDKYCVCVCVREIEKERETERQRERQTDRQTDTESKLCPLGMVIVLSCLTVIMVYIDM